MNNKSLIQKIKNLPVPILPTMVGASTLANVYSGMGYTWVRHLTIWAAIAVLIAYIVKMVAHFDTVKNEYSNTVPASLYAGFTMITMIIGSYIYTYNAAFGKALWFIGLILHAIHILIFTYRNVVKGVNMQTFVPSWFVTYNGIMVSTVVGGVMNEPLIGKIVVYYGIAVFTIIIPFMIYRLAKYEIKDPMYHTQAIVLAPSSLCLVSYLNFIQTPNKFIVYYLYFAVICALIFIISKLPKFFSYIFHPGFAGLTFPMAIGIVASTKMSAYLIGQGYETFGYIVNQIAGIQIYITTGIISVVLFKFFMMLVDSYKQNHKTKLATYASRCIENEILMHLRANKKTNLDVSLNETIGIDKDGSEIVLGDTIAIKQDEFIDIIDKKDTLNRLTTYFNILDPREKETLIMHYGLNNTKKYSQKEIAKKLNISRSYVSRLEKRALIKLLKKHMEEKP